jgi:hypothetical protein
LPISHHLPCNYRCLKKEPETDPSAIKKIPGKMEDHQVSVQAFEEHPGE